MAHFLVVGHSPFLPSMALNACGGLQSQWGPTIASRAMTESMGYTLEMQHGNRVTLVRHMLALPPADKTHEADMHRLPSPEGMAQAAERQQQFEESNMYFDGIYSSPLVRAKVMAAILSTNSPNPIQILNQLGYEDFSSPDMMQMADALSTIGTKKSFDEGWTDHRCWHQLMQHGNRAWEAFQNRVGHLYRVIGIQIWN